MPALAFRATDDDSQFLTDQAAAAGLWRRGHQAFADSRIAARILLVVTPGLLLPMAATGYFVHRSSARTRPRRRRSRSV